VHQLLDDQHRPALADQVESVGHGAVLVVAALSHASILAETLALVKGKLAKNK
jgi:hypothetical protein